MHQAGRRHARASRRTFAIDVMCHPLLLALRRRDPAARCARYQLNLGHLLQRGPGSEEQWLHRDERCGATCRGPHPELQLASVIAFVDFTRENGATRVVPGQPPLARPRARRRPSRCWRRRPTPDQIAYAEMPAGSAVIYTGGTIHAGGANTTDVPRRGAHLSYCLGWLRTEENNYLVGAARGRRHAAAPGAGAARLRRARQHRRAAAATSAWCACRTRSTSSSAATSDTAANSSGQTVQDYHDLNTIPSDPVLDHLGGSRRQAAFLAGCLRPQSGDRSWLERSVGAA